MVNTGKILIANVTTLNTYRFEASTVRERQHPRRERAGCLRENETMNFDANGQENSRTVDEHDDVTDIARALERGTRAERVRAAWALAAVAVDRPEAASSAVPALATAATARDQWVRRGTALALEKIAANRPRSLTPAVRGLSRLLRDDDRQARQSAAAALASAAAPSPWTIKPAADALTVSLGDDDEQVRRHAAEALTRLAAVDDDLRTTLYPHIIKLPRDERPAGARIFEQEDDTDEQLGDGERRPRDPPPDDSSEPKPVSPSVGHGPPKTITSGPAFDGTFEAFERLEPLPSNAHTTAYKARRSTKTGEQVVALSALSLSGPSTSRTKLSAEFAQTMTNWHDVDDHDHVASVLDWGRRPRPWLATEFMDVGTIRERIGRTTLDEALWYALAVVSAVCHAHGYGVVHGALAPDDVLLTETLEDAWLVPKVTGWGLPELFRSDSTSRRWVRPPYAAPEHLDPDSYGEPDHATDIYGVGTVLYELFTGAPPFEGSAEDGTPSVLDESPQPASDANPRLPDDLDVIVERALAKPKHHRYETAEDLRRELELVARPHLPSDVTEAP